MENIYIKAIEIGFKNPKGITYFDLKEQIEREIEFSSVPEAQVTFIDWFLEYFYSPEVVEPDIDRVLISSKAYLLGHSTDSSYKRNYDNILGKLFFIKGLTLKYYLDYKELQEARDYSQKALTKSNESLVLSRKSLKVSNKSFLVALLAFAIPTILTFWFNITSEDPIKPPYEVIIIEDNTSTPQLEKEVKELRDQLYEAKMLIGLYEDPTSHKLNSRTDTTGLFMKINQFFKYKENRDSKEKQRVRELIQELIDSGSNNTKN